MIQSIFPPIPSPLVFQLPFPEAVSYVCMSFHEYTKVCEHILSVMWMVACCTYYVAVCLLKYIYIYVSWRLYHINAYGFTSSL